MKYPSLSLFFTLATTLASPAFATWIDVGQVRVFSSGGRFERHVRIAGPVEHLRVTAEGDDIFCRAVNAQYRARPDRLLFQGILHRDHAIDIDFFGKDRDVQALGFQCRSEHRGASTIRITADRMNSRHFAAQS